MQVQPPNANLLKTNPGQCSRHGKVTAWLAASGCRFGPVFRKVNRWGAVELTALHPDAVRQILLRRAAQAGLTVSGLERLSPHGLRAGFITEAYKASARRDHHGARAPPRHPHHARHVRRAKLVGNSPAGEGYIQPSRKCVIAACGGLRTTLTGGRPDGAGDNA
jgi:hypothetical protein